MKKLIYFVVLTAITVTAFALCGNTALAQGENGKILNPGPGEQITDTQPMIGVELPANLASYNTATETVKIYFFLDGTDITSEAQISVEYIFFIPPMPLALGNHNIMIKTKIKDITTGTERDITGMAPISWSFTVVTKVTRVQTSLPSLSEKPITTGKFSISMANTDLNSGNRNITGGFPDTDIKYPEKQSAITSVLDFTHRHYGKSITGHYERNIEEITGRANEYFHFRFLDQNDDITVGDYPVTQNEFSEYSMTGFRMRGIKAVQQANAKYKVTTVLGRSQEPQNGRYKRSTYGVKIDTSLSKNDKIKIIALNSKETGISSTSTVPKHDSIGNIQNTWNVTKKWKTFTELAFSNHTERGLATSTALGKDFAYKNSVTYKSRRVESALGRRTVGPSFNPTVLGTFIEADREGNFASFNYTPSSRFGLRTSFDTYHNNVRHNATYDYTDKSTNGIASLLLNYPHLPTANARYSKLYTKTDADTTLPNTSDNESTNANFSLSKSFNDLYIFNGTNLSWNFGRYDIDRGSHSSSNTLINFNLRSDTRSYNFTTRITDFALISYTTSINKSFIHTISTVPATNVTPAQTTISINDSRTNTDGLGVQLNIIPFKFITNFNYRRSAQTTFTTYTANAVTSSSLAAAPMEKQHIVSFIYYLSQKKKLNLDIENYDKEYRAAANIGRAYDEQIIRLGYTTEF